MKTLLSTAVLAVALPAAAVAQDVTLTIKDHRFEPSSLTLPAGERIKLTVDNQDATPEEFEGEDFNAEKIIPGNTKGFVWVGPFEPGKYEFVGEFHEDTAKGVFIVE